MQWIVLDLPRMQCGIKYKCKAYSMKSKILCVRLFCYLIAALGTVGKSAKCNFKYKGLQNGYNLVGYTIN